jgi:hypothetical protein
LRYAVRIAAADTVGGTPRMSWRTMLASGSGGYGQLLAWSLGLVVMLGVGSIGVLRFAYVSFHQPARRPAWWMFAFALVPLVILGLGGDITFAVPWLWLVPIAFVGLLDFERMRIWLLGVLALVGVLLVRTVESGAREDDWYNLVVFRVRPGDLVIAADREQHAAILSGLKIDVIPADRVDLPNIEYDIDPAQEIVDRIEAARAAHRRVVIDVREPTAFHPDWIRLDGPNFQRLRDQGAVDLDALPP